MAIATLISSLYRDASERNFSHLLSAHLFNLIGSAGVDSAGTLEGTPDLGDFRYTVPESGWYWEVQPVSGDIKGQIRSLSMTAELAAPAPQDVPFDSEYRRTYRATGLAQEELQVVESEFFLDDANGVARFRVMGNRTELEAEITAFSRQLNFFLALLGIGMIAINAIAILFGLRPLDRVRGALTAIRSGEADRLDGKFPDEVKPLINELNALIESNRSIVERSRTQVGNLAHSLKTPLAVLTNESSAMGGARGKLVAEQARAMQTQIDHYLQRARIAAQRNTLAHRTDAVDALRRMVRVIGKLKQNVMVDFEVPAEELYFAGEKEDFEEIIGNLLENAAKWARSRVLVSARSASTDTQHPVLEIMIADDGPGIPEEQAREAVKRGRRLDEATPGTGLGLAIVTDLVTEYGGKLKLSRSALGGLAAIVTLKRAG